jgi:hypothetical protein
LTWSHPQRRGGVLEFVDLLAGLGDCPAHRAQRRHLARQVAPAAIRTARAGGSTGGFFRVLLFQSGELFGEVPRGDRGGGIVELSIGVERTVFRRVEQLGEELVSFRIDAPPAQPRLRLKRRREKVRSPVLVGAGSPEPLALGDEVAPPAQSPLVHFQGRRVRRFDRVG